MLLVALVTAASTAAAAYSRPAAAPGMHWVVLADDGRRVGEQWLECASRTSCQARLEFADGVQAPRFAEHWNFGADGIVTEYRADGRDARDLPFTEQFSLSAGLARWSSPIEHGSGHTNHRSFYVPSHISPANLQVMTETAARNDGPLDLLPAGALRQAVVGELAARDAKRGRLLLLQQVGLDLPPGFLWVTDTPTPQLVAVIRPGHLTIVADGYEGDVPAMRQAQHEAEARLLAGIASDAGQPLAGVTRIRNTRVFDAEHAALGPPQDVYIEGDRILAVEPIGSTAAATTTIEAHGRVLLPGLFDMHAHLQRWDGVMHLAAGVTSVRDVGNDDDALQALIEDIEARHIPGPRVTPVGFIEGAGEHSANYGVRISTLPEAIAAIAAYGARGFRQVKTYNNAPQSLLPALAQEAHGKGMRISGHVPPGANPGMLVDAGFNEIHHVDRLLLSSLPDESRRPWSGDRFELLGEQLADVDLDATPARDLPALLAKRGVAVDPTLSAFEFLSWHDGVTSADHESSLQHLPLHLQRSVRASSMRPGDAQQAGRYRRSYSTLLGLVGLLHRAGVPLVTGSDGIAGFGLQRELECLVLAGIPPAEVLRLATWSAARDAGVRAERGSIEAGKLADLVLVDGDPTVAIQDVRRVMVVFTRGRMFHPTALHRIVGVEPFVTETPVTTPERN